MLGLIKNPIKFNRRPIEINKRLRLEASKLEMHAEFKYRNFDGSGSRV